MLIAPSVLSADFSKLGEEVAAVTKAGADWIHLDIMDGQFVPTITFGPQLVKSVRKYSEAVFDVHLMIDNPGNMVLIDQFAASGADYITFHAEVAPHAHRIIQHIHELGKKAGIALNPGTSINMIEDLICDADMVLLMTVNPGAGGQKYIHTVTDKIARLKKMCEEKGVSPIIQVDGGISKDTIKEAASAGANCFVAGSAVFGKDDYSAAIECLRKAAE